MQDDLSTKLKDFPKDILARETIKELIQNTNLIISNESHSDEKKVQFLRNYFIEPETVENMAFLQENIFLIKEVNPSILTSVNII